MIKATTVYIAAINAQSSFIFAKEAQKGSLPKETLLNSTSRLFFKKKKIWAVNTEVYIVIVSYGPLH